MLVLFERNMRRENWDRRHYCEGLHMSSEYVNADRNILNIFAFIRYLLSDPQISC